MRNMSRDPVLSKAPATDVFTPIQIEILRLQSNRTLPPRLDVRTATLAMAKYCGGHIKNNGEPGWKVLGRAYEDLLKLEKGWHLAHLQRCDLS